jgi:sugar lactone lactonase YvrE
MKMLLHAFAGFLTAAMPLSAIAQSYYPVRLDDKTAVYVMRGSGDATGDGVADDTAALQRAINKVEETTGQGVVFLPEGTYRLSRTLYIWPGIRVIGYGQHRPRLILGDHTPGYGGSLAYMVFFTGGRADQAKKNTPPRAPRHVHTRSDTPFPGTVPAALDVIDANPGTFYSAMSNIDFDLGEGNPGAVGIRFHAAQHCFLTHMEFHIRSGMAALNDVGNEGEDLHFIGGRYGIITSKPSPGWQYTLLDSSFENQTETAIKEHEAGLTLVHDTFRHVPAAVSIDPGYAEELWIKNSRFEDISGPAITISNEKNARTEINVEDVVSSGTPVFAHFRESGIDVAAPSDEYTVHHFSHGLTIDKPGDVGSIRTSFDATKGAKPGPKFDQRSLAIRDLPTHEGWANVRALGAKGDGVTDDTEAIRHAIHDHRTIFFPAGRYLVSDTITLRPDTVLIGLHPSTTQLLLAENTAGFVGPGAPKPLLTTSTEGNAIITGIGIYTGGTNNRATGVLWQSGQNSLMDDVRFLGGHGTNNADGTRMNPYNANHTGDPDPLKKWDSEYPSLWVTNNGGGTFADIWTPSTFADAGMYISNTSTEGHVYELSSEHHVRMEVKLDHVSNWELVALQTEEEHGEGGRALPLEIENSNNVTVANFHSYRVVGMLDTFPYGISVSGSHEIHFRNLHMDSNSKVSFDNAIYDGDNGSKVRYREFGSLDISSSTGPSRTAPETDVRKLAGGFYNISGAAFDPKGNLYFADIHQQKVYRWSPTGGSDAGTLDTIVDAPLDIANLFIDPTGDLMMVSYQGKGTVYALKQNAPLGDLQLLHPVPPIARPGMIPVLANDYWSLRGELINPTSAITRFQYTSPDSRMFLSASEAFTTGALFYGTKMADVLRTFGLQPVVPGHTFYLTDEEEEKTYSAEVDASGNLSNLRLFAERGGERVATDSARNVYIAAGEVFIYKADGTEAGIIRVPERPINLVVNPEGDKLYILARTSLYEVDLLKPR